MNMLIERGYVVLFYTAVIQVVSIVFLRLRWI